MTNPTPPMTAAKAHGAALSVVITAALAYFGIGAMPETAALADAIHTLAGTIAYVLGSLITAGVAWLTTYVTRNKPKITSSILATMMMIGILAGMTACGDYGERSDDAGDLTPEQLAYKISGDFEALQVGALAIVTNEATPGDVKIAIAAAEDVAYAAVTSYVDAVREGRSDLATYLGAAVASCARLLDVLVANGWIAPDFALLAWTGPPGVPSAGTTLLIA